jgi:coatomer subunit beta'
VEDVVKDGESMSLPVKELGTSETYPQTLQHSPNGRFVVVCGDGEYVVYTALAWRNKTFGQGLDFVWAQDSNQYAVRESATRIKVFKNFKEKTGVFQKLGYAAEGMFGGTLLAIRSAAFLNFYDWETSNLIRRIDVVPRNVFWSDAGDLVAIVCDDATYILRFDRTAYNAFLETGAQVDEEGVEEAFELVTELSETVKSGCWVGDCFIYTNSVYRLGYLVGTETFTIAHFDREMHLLGYIPRDNRVYLADKDVSIVSFALSLTVVEYQTAVLRGDLETASQILPDIPTDQRTRVARFLESQDLKQLALEVSVDDDQRFELALHLGKLDICTEIAHASASQQKFRIVGDAALKAWKFSLAEECLKQADDLSGLLLLYQASGNAAGMLSVANLAAEKGLNNIAFTCFLQLGMVDRCIDVLTDADRIAEATLFARSYAPSQMPRLVQRWKMVLKKQNRHGIAELLADPLVDEDLFPNYKESLQAEQVAKQKTVEDRSSVEYSMHKHEIHKDLIAESVTTDVEEVEETMSMMSMEVNTTGTGSVKEDDFDH